MDLEQGQESLGSIAGVVFNVRKKGVRLWSQNGRLHFKAPKGTLTEWEIETLRASKSQIVALLERAAGADIADLDCQRRERIQCAPLTYSQFAHWSSNRLSERRSLRQIASATRLSGRLNVGALRRGLAEVVRRHDALRTRIAVHEGLPTQEIHEAGRCDLSLEDLTTLPENVREAQIRRHIDKLVMEPVDVGKDPLLAVRLLKLRDDEHVLIVAMEHMISDAFSMRILLRDLFTAYMQAIRGRPFELPEITVQFGDYAAWQAKGQHLWIESHGAYWRDHMTGCGRVRFPADEGLSSGGGSGWGSVSLRIGSELKAELLELCRLRRTTLAMSALAAYSALVLRWCRVSDGVIRYVTDNRVDPKIEHTIGYFASSLYLRAQLCEGESFSAFMSKLMAEYCKAHDHADYSYLDAQAPQPEFVRNSAFNWVPRGSRFRFQDLEGSDDSLECSPITFRHPMLSTLNLDSEPVMLLSETDDEVSGHVSFPLNRLSQGTMNRFAESFLVFLNTLLRRPAQRVTDIPLA